MFRRSILTSLATVMVLSASAFPDGFFSVRPGLPTLTGTQIGIGGGNSFFVGGMDYAFIKGSSEYKEKRLDSYYDGYEMVDSLVVSTEELDVSVHLFMPSLGFKQYFLRDPIAPYIQANAFLTIPKVNYTREDSDDDYYFEDDDYEDELEEGISKSISTFGFSFAFGMEHFFTPNFSIGGEFGFNLFLNSIVDEEDDEDYSYKSDFLGTLGLTRSSICLNYHFGVD